MLFYQWIIIYADIILSYKELTLKSLKHIFKGVKICIPLLNLVFSCIRCHNKFNERTNVNWVSGILL